MRDGAELLLSRVVSGELEVFTTGSGQCPWGWHSLELVPMLDVTPSQLMAVTCALKGHSQCPSS